MMLITHFRRKCIGCNACSEISGHRWKMSHTDGKAVLVGAKNSGDVFTLRVTDDEWDEQKRAEENCPVGIIRVQK